MTTAEISQKASRLVSQQPLARLVEMFEMASDPDVRGWIMDELESRNPQAFSDWLDSTEDSPRRFYL